MYKDCAVCGRRIQGWGTVVWTLARRTIVGRAEHAADVCVGARVRSRAGEGLRGLGVSLQVCCRFMSAAPLDLQDRTVTEKLRPKEDSHLPVVLEQRLCADNVSSRGP